LYRDTNAIGDTGDTMDLLVASLREAFGARAIEVAEHQLCLAASEDVARTWRLIAEKLAHP
jgi:hypothetical protein